MKILFLSLIIFVMANGGGLLAEITKCNRADTLACKKVGDIYAKKYRDSLKKKLIRDDILLLYKIARKAYSTMCINSIDEGCNSFLQMKRYHENNFIDFSEDFL